MTLEPANTLETAVWDAFPTGTKVDATTFEDKQVRAEFISALLLGARERVPGATASVYVTGAQITGQLRLAFASVPFPLLLQDCVFAERPDFYWAQMDLISFGGSTLPGLSASNLTVAKHLRMSQCKLTDELRLPGAQIQGALLLFQAELAAGMAAERIRVGGDLHMGRMKSEGALNIFKCSVGGNLDMDGATLGTAGKLALAADSMTIAGAWYARQTRIFGEVSLRHAKVDGAVTFSGAQLSNPGKVALRADRATIDGGLFLLGPFAAEGEVRMVSTKIGRGLNLVDAKLTNPGARALNAEFLMVEGGINASKLTASGSVVLTDANIAGPVRFEAAHLSQPGGDALNAIGVHTTSIFDCCDGFTSLGRVNFSGAQIGGTLCFNHAELKASDTAAEPNEAAGTVLKLWRTQAPELATRWDVSPDGTVDLRFSRIGVHRDNPECWPTRLRLDGMTCEYMEPSLPAIKRLALLARDSDGYRPQPYEQLAAAFRRIGHDDDARTVLEAKQRRRNRTLGGLSRVWGIMQDVTIGYGYRPLRAALWLMALLLIGTVTFTLQPPFYSADGTPPVFDPVVYALDVLVPLVDFGQQAAYSPTGASRWIAYALIAAGWVLATTVAAGATRSLRKE